MFPTFKINKVINAEKSIEVTGIISSNSFNNHKWVDDKWSDPLKLNNSIVFGRWHKQNGGWKFVVEHEDNAKADFSNGQKVECFQLKKKPRF